MKRFTLVSAAIAAIILSACGKMENTAPVVSKLEVVLNIEAVSSDILDYFDIEYAYKDFDGNVVVEKITKPGSIAFSIDNPSLGEEPSTPFTVQMTLSNKGTAEKADGEYDSTFKWELDVNAYDRIGKLITDSGRVQRYSSNVVFGNDKFKNFLALVCSEGKISSITYSTFFCKTDSGEWHIGVNGILNSGVVLWS